MKRTAHVALSAMAFVAFGLQAKADTVFTAMLNGAADGVTTAGTGFAMVDVNSSMTQITYTLTFQNLGSDATMGHIHFGAVGVNGPPLLWFFPPSLMPTPSATSGSYSGTWTQSNLAAQSQDSAITSFATLLGDMQAGNTYVNVHTVNYPNGEIRGQLMMTPEPGSLSALGLLLLGGLALFRKKTQAT